MAIIQFGSIVSDARNSVGSQTYSKNKGGGYVKSKPTPTQPRTAAQRLVRANFAANSRSWSSVLTDAQRAAWAFFAQANPYNNIFGQSKQYSGFNMYMKLNQVLAQIGEAQITTPPTDLSVPALDTITGIAATVVSNALTVLNMLATFESAADSLYYLFATPPLKAGRSAGVSDYRYIGTISDPSTGSTLSILSLYTAVFGTAIPAGSHLSVLVSTVNTASGATTPGFEFDTGTLT